MVREEQRRDGGGGAEKERGVGPLLTRSATPAQLVQGGEIRDRGTRGKNMEFSRKRNI